MQSTAARNAGLVRPVASSIPGACMYTVSLPRAADGTLGIVFQVAPIAAPARLVVAGFSADAASAGDSEASKFVNIGDHLLVVGDADVQRSSAEEVNAIVKAMPPGRIPVRLHRIEAGVCLRGILRADQAGMAKDDITKEIAASGVPAAHMLPALVTALVVGDQRLAFGPVRVLGAHCAVQADNILLSVFGTAAAALTNYHRYLCRAADAAFAAHSSGREDAAAIAAATAPSGAGLFGTLQAKLSAAGSSSRTAHATVTMAIGCVVEAAERQGLKLLSQTAVTASEGPDKASAAYLARALATRQVPCQVYGVAFGPEVSTEFLARLTPANKLSEFPYSARVGLQTTMTPAQYRQLSAQVQAMKAHMLSNKEERALFEEGLQPSSYFEAKEAEEGKKKPSKPSGGGGSKKGKLVSRGRGRRRKPDSDDEDDYGDDSDDEAGYAPHTKAADDAGPVRRSGRQRSAVLPGAAAAAALDADEDDNDFGDELEGADDAADDDGGRGGSRAAVRSRSKSKGPKPWGKKGGGSSGGAGGGKGKGKADEDEEKEKSDLPEAGVTKWTVEVILAVRYADLPRGPDEPVDTRPAPATEEEEAAREAEMAQLQLKRRLALPADQQRHWESLEYLVKWKGLSYLHVEWVAASLLKSQGIWGPIRARKYMETDRAAAQLDEEEARMGAGKEPPPNETFFDETALDVERILSERRVIADLEDADITRTAGGAVGMRNEEQGYPEYAGQGGLSKEEEAEAIRDGYTVRTAYLTKWRGLPYSASSWEWAEDVHDDSQLAEFKRHNIPPGKDAVVTRDSQGRDARPDVRTYVKSKESPVFKNGRTLRDYQLEGLNWMAFNWYNRRNCILADEMGLGKTCQTVSIIEYLRTQQDVRGPFLVIAPLSTLGHWKREFEQWTDANAIVYHDPQRGFHSRDLIRKYEWYYPGPEGKTMANRGIFKFNVLITSYQVLLTDWDHFSAIRWRYVAVDEAHSLKNQQSKLLQALHELRYDSLLLLTGTPLQNDVQELWSLLNLVAPHKYDSLDDFISRYGELKTSEQLMALQSELDGIMLRRQKEHVEKSIPPKEETIINVELTKMQKAYYRAVLDRNRSFLMAGGGKDKQVGHLVYVEMELRKCCNHPFLLRNAEQRETAACAVKEERLEMLINASGKTVLMDKLLPKLRAEGHRVLIFSQFKGMLDLLEQMLKHRAYKYERIDGSIRGNDRQAAIDRFNKPDSDSFAFLLSTRAGGQGINLTAADTVIIFDSDWNPQNDVQAMARAHRIGQTKDVRIYRLLTSKTYEAAMFRRASRKLGLSQAVFESGGGGRFKTGRGRGDDYDGGSGAAGEEGLDGEGGRMSDLLTMDKESVEKLLRFGAYAIMEDEEANAAEATFKASSIDDILGASVTMRYDPSGKQTVVAADGHVIETVDTGAGAGAGSGGAASSGGGSGGSADGAAASAAPEAVKRGGLSKAKYSLGNIDETNLDVNDDQFWEKYLGPRPADQLLQQLQEGILQRGEEKVAQWVADATALLDDVYEAKMQGETHDSADRAMQILALLLDKGSKVPHPLSPAALVTRGSSGGASSSGGIPPLPLPSPSLMAMLSALAAAAASARSAASAGRGAPPEVDEEGTQNDGMLSTFGEWWIRKLEQSGRQRKRQRLAAFGADSNANSDIKVKRRRRSGPGAVLDEEGGEGEDAGAGDGEGEEGGENYTPVRRGRGRPRGSGNGGARPRRTADQLVTVGEGEKEVDAVLGLPSVSNIRIRVSKWAPVIKGEQYASALKTLKTAAAGGGAGGAGADETGSPNAMTDSVDAPTPSSTGGSGSGGAAAAAAAAAGPALAVPEERHDPFHTTMPASMLARSGFTRAQVLAAASVGMSVEEYVERLTATGQAPTGTFLIPDNLMEEEKPLVDFQRAQTKRIAAWLMMNRTSRAAAAEPALPPPEPAEEQAGQAMMRVLVQPMRVQIVYNTASTKTIKPEKVRGPRISAPMWALLSKSVDVREEEKRLDRRMYAAKRAGAAGAGEGAGDGTPGGGGARGRPRGRPPKGELAAAAASRAATNGLDEEDSEMGGAAAASSSSAATAAAPEDAFCLICGGKEGTEDDPIILCDQCDMACHKLCYGVQEIPPGDAPWYCDVCEARKAETDNPDSAAAAAAAPTPAPDALQCSICNMTGGAFKRCAPLPHDKAVPRDRSGKALTDRSGWAHVVCALWSPCCSFGDVDRMTPIRDWQLAATLPEAAVRCSVCSKADAGPTTRCVFPGCTKAFHPLCGRRAAYRMEMSDEGQLQAFCPAHAYISDDALEEARIEAEEAKQDGDEDDGEDDEE